MTTNGPEGIEDVTRMIEGVSEQTRREKSGDDVPGGFGRFAAVVRIGFGDRLAPALLPVALNPHEQKGAIVAAAKTGFEKADERKAAEPQIEPIDSH